jgi:cytochrome b6-f complex iron-sulfur subunit
MNNTTQNTTNDLPVVSGRRKFLNRLWALLGGLAFIEFSWLGLSILSSRKGKRTAEREDVFISAGEVKNFTPLSVTAIPKGQFYLACLEDGSFLALSRTCTHLGCSVPWDLEKSKFICPCHGSTFDIAGEVLTPPATRALDSYPVRIENGMIRVNIARSEKRLQNGKPRSVKV